MRLAVPDLVSNSYFPAIAAVELGYMRDEGVDIALELLFPVTDAAAALRDGSIDFLAGAAHAPLYVDRDWSDLRLLAALSQNMYWFLVTRPDLDVTRDSLEHLRDVRIGAAPGPDLGLRELFVRGGVDVESRGIAISPVPGTDADSTSFGVTAADALEAGRIDAFWANGMGAEVAVRRGIGKVVLDARRDGGEAASFTFPALMTTKHTVEDRPETTAKVTRAVLRAQRELRRSPELATKVGEALFPPVEASLIAELVSRDREYYDPVISPKSLAGVADFTRSTGLTDGELDYEQIVPAAARKLWTS